MSKQTRVGHPIYNLLPMEVERFDSHASWLEGNGVIPEAVAIVKGLDENLRLQDQVTQKLKNLRYIHGMFCLETIEAKPLFIGDRMRVQLIDTNVELGLSISRMSKRPDIDKEALNE